MHALQGAALVSQGTVLTFCRRCVLVCAINAAKVGKAYMKIGLHDFTESQLPLAAV